MKTFKMIAGSAYTDNLDDMVRDYYDYIEEFQLIDAAYEEYASMMVDALWEAGVKPDSEAIEELAAQLETEKDSGWDSVRRALQSTEWEERCNKCREIMDDASDRFQEKYPQLINEDLVGIEDTGKHWNSELVTVRLDGYWYLLDGWDGKKFAECWSVDGREAFERVDDFVYELTPVSIDRDGDGVQFELMGYIVE